MEACYYSKYEPIFGSWHIVEKIGSGGEGNLYRIRREDALGNEYFSALKAITIPSGGESEIESLMAGGLTREEVCEYYENFVQDTVKEFDLMAKMKGNSYISSYEDHEIFECEDHFGWDILIRIEELTPLVKASIEHPLSPEDVARMGADICRGLVFCQQYGIVHRDIKPDNIFIAPSGNYKLGDFGIARILEQTQSVLSRKGTYSYMAPEVYWGKPYGPSVDLYSLGLVMYRYLNEGRLPFMPDPPAAVHYQDEKDAMARRISAEKMTAPRNGSVALSAIVLRACAYDPKDRYKTAEEMLRDLEKLLFQETGSVDSFQQKKPRISRRGRIIAAVIALCVVAAGIIWAVIPKEVTAIEGIGPKVSVYIGDQLAPEYAVEPNWFKDEPVSFTSSDEEVFTVDQNGVIRAVGVGKAELVMNVRGYEQKSAVTVESKVKKIRGLSNMNLEVGDSRKLAVKLRPQKFADEPVAYKIADRSVATVTKNGKIEAVSEGTTELTVSAGGFAKTVRIRVTEPEPEPVYVEPAYDYTGGYSGGSGGSSSSGGGSSKKHSSSGKKSGSSVKGTIDNSDDKYFK